jgi:hypothetical protein
MSSWIYYGFYKQNQVWIFTTKPTFSLLCIFDNYVEEIYVNNNPNFEPTLNRKCKFQSIEILGIILHHNRLYPSPLYSVYLLYVITTILAIYKYTDITYVWTSFSICFLLSI